MTDTEEIIERRMNQGVPQRMQLVHTLGGWTAVDSEEHRWVLHGIEDGPVQVAALDGMWIDAGKRSHKDTGVRLVRFANKGPDDYAMGKSFRDDDGYFMFHGGRKIVLAGFEPYTGPGMGDPRLGQYVQALLVEEGHVGVYLGPM